MHEEVTSSPHLEHSGGVRTDQRTGYNAGFVATKFTNFST